MRKIAGLSALLILQLFALPALTQEDGASQGGAQDAAEPQSEGEPSEPVSDDVFIPSEEVQAAEELTFPVNI